LPGEDADTVVQGIKEALGKTAIEEKIEIELVKQMFPFEGDPESFISKQVSAVNEAITGKISPFGYLTFASNGGYLTSKMKIPSVVYGPGRITDLIPVEHIEISSVVTAAKVYAGTAIEVFCR
jgi:acetylornithine deacetylase/succinyl-diaminopimelate desuccinylase-like protein